MTTATNPSGSTRSTETTEDFQLRKTFTSPPAAVLEALSSSDGIDGGWGDTIGSPKEGGTFEVGFGSERRIVLTAAAVDEGRVEWMVQDAPHTPEWLGTTIVFDITPAAGGTELWFRHHGLTTQLECFDMCHEGWTHYLASLVDYVDRGAGHPYRHGRGGRDTDGES